MYYSAENLDYDITDPASIERYGQNLIGMTFAEVCDKDDITDSRLIRETNNYDLMHEDKKRKGGLGEIIEERYFHYQTNSDSRPDFDQAGVELKVTPFKKAKDGSLMAKERLILTMIDYFTVVDEEFEESHMWIKARLILLIYYLYKKDAPNRLAYQIKYVKLFTPPEQDVKIIKHDFESIRDKIREGRAQELSESDTLYLGAATKAATSEDRRKQPYSDIPAKPRAFAFKQSYMTYVLNNYIVVGRKTYEPIMKGEVAESFEDYVIDKIKEYHDYSVDDLCREFDIDDKKRPKNLEALLAYRILGIKGNHAEEFEKANVVVKTIRVAVNDRIKESMSFPTFRFKELIKEDWDDSTFGNYLRETRFLFIIYKYDETGTLRLKGCQFWNMPYNDLEEHVRKVWEATKKAIKDGLQISIKNGVHYSNLPKASDDPVCHVRPHGRNAQDTDELPDGRRYPKQCFWLNNNYILNQLDKNIYKN